MAGGWAKDGAEHEQMESTLEDAVQRARSQLPRGELCVVCQGELDKKQSAYSGYNRRGSKDSQLR